MHAATNPINMYSIFVIALCPDPTGSQIGGSFCARCYP
jgi:hypothetical protein